MKTLLPLLVLLLLAGCSTPQSRARSNPELMESLPPELQAKVEAGEVELGYTEEMVRVALGKPDRKYSQLTEAGRTEVWSYHKGGLGSRLSFGVGTSVGRGSGTYGGGVSIGTGGRLRPEEETRVTFSGDGRVIEIQHAE